MKNAYIHAEPAIDSEGNFLQRFVQFKVFEVRETLTSPIETFTGIRVYKLDLSLSDNRVVRF